MLVRPLVEEVGDGLGLPCGGLRWTLDIDETLRVDADHDHLYRVLSNICRNALQALEGQTGKPDETEEAEIRVSASRSGRQVSIDIRDNGPGLPPKAREHLFQAFQSSQRRGGSGLGLAIAQELVSAHGGTLELLDDGPGAAFRIIIPDRSPAA